MWKHFIGVLLLSAGLAGLCPADASARDPYGVYDQIDPYGRIDKERTNPSYNAYDEIRAYKIDEEDEPEEEKCDCAEPPSTEVNVNVTQ